MLADESRIDLCREISRRPGEEFRPLHGKFSTEQLAESTGLQSRLLRKFDDGKGEVKILGYLRLHSPDRASPFF